MIDYLAERNRSMVRSTLSAVVRSQQMVSDQALDHATQWFDRIGVTEAIRSAMKKRFAVGITKGDDGYETYTRGEMTAEIDAGFYECVDIGIGQRIVAALASLFTRADQSWAYTSASGEPDEDAASIIESHRMLGGAYAALVGADRLACAVESSAVRLAWEGGHLRYEAVPPQNIKILYGSTVLDDGVARAVNATSLEDASAVVVRLSGSLQSTGGSYTDCRWIAYVGRCEEYPLGRCVTYQAPADAYDRIPPVGAAGTYDVRRVGSEEVCNPLSWLAESTDYRGSEYPIVLIRGGHVHASDTVMPAITTLYESVVEITLGWSRVLKDALSGALGREVLGNPMGAALPPVTEGIVVLREGQTYEVKAMGSGSILAAVEVLYASSGALANGWSVPSYTVVAKGGGVPESGVALAIQTAPLLEMADYRRRINSHAVEGMFAVEAGLISYHLDDEIIDYGTTASWSPGSVPMPSAESDRVAAIVAARDAGLIDEIAAIREYHGLATDEDAIELHTQMAERSKAAPRIGQAAVRTSPALPPRAAK